VELLPDHRHPGEQRVRRRYKKAYGENSPPRPDGKPPTSRCTCGKNTVEKAGSFDVKAILDNADGVSFDAPEGKVTIDA
jgi:urea transport system substrate-binding protein